ncbi:MAG: hypothetical protein HC933_07710 [Pleurocapsa sp. SU_196_0]|nr:hypothetical protein [Pleurocapsa sp. SU_196_0]
MSGLIARAFIALVAILGSSSFAQSLAPTLQTNFIAFPVTTLEGKALTVTGKLQIPRALTGKAPAVVILHGSAGVDSRGTLHATIWRGAGFVTLELDLWGPRGLTGGSGSRSSHPSENLPDVYGAFSYLARLPQVDARRIGIMGFSWGGVLALLTAQKDLTARFLKDGQRFAAHLSFYPAICWGLNRVPGFEWRGFTDAPIRILVGALDRYEADPQGCEKMLERSHPRIALTSPCASLKVAYHGFNMLEASSTYPDPYTNQGRGGEGYSESNPKARLESRVDVLRFFSRLQTTSGLNLELFALTRGI